MLGLNDPVILVLVKPKPGRSVHGERANFPRLVLSCIEADFCYQIFFGTRIFFEKGIDEKALAEIYEVHSVQQLCNDESNLNCFCKRIAEILLNFTNTS